MPESLASAVNAAQSHNPVVPKGLTMFNSDELGVQYFHCLIYGETDARKTVTAAKFAPPEKTLIVFTRNIEQAKPLRGMGVKIVQALTADAIGHALQFPETLAPEWAKQEDRVLVLDDASEAVSILKESKTKEVGDAFGRDVKEAGTMLKQYLRSAIKKKQHLIITALAKPSMSKITKEEKLSIDLPPSILDMIGADLEYAFYIRRGKWKLLTETDIQTFEEYDPEQKKFVTATREIFAKNKLPLNLATRNPRVLFKEESMDLRAIWDKIVAAEKMK